MKNASINFVSGTIALLYDHVNLARCKKIGGVTGITVLYTVTSKDIQGVTAKKLFYLQKIFYSDIRLFTYDVSQNRGVANPLFPQSAKV